MLGGASCAFLAGPWTGRDPIQHLIAACLIGLGIALWLATVTFMKRTGERPA
ncbi:hypothetical protein LH464_00875 [Neorhizobium sp. T786]|uniref:hypothetical protein n=1 Tax=Pseudorhizobium xiangyangii TaxID=2883104 RepID=UPI001CFFBDCF|nr:hypothetical protein [Neorhizobium xiangyangii]MCB5201028.1 hypothetical protein [Neorhizobium xiangyangii]